jgi:H2-forming N5,N10-methylenetetrahydromethanopterin dehydrogenase-like enzyme
MLGLAYLTQTLGTNAASSEVSGLQADLKGLDTDLRRQSIHLMNLTESDAVIDRARAQGFRSLGEPLVLRAP